MSRPCSPIAGRVAVRLRVLQALQYHARTGRVTPGDWYPGLTGLLPQRENVGKY